MKKTNAWDEQKLSPKAQVAEALQIAREMREEADYIVATAFRESGYKAKPQVFAEDVVKLMKAGLEVELDEEYKPKVNALTLVAIYARSLGLKGKKQRKYVERSMHKKSKRGFSKGCNVHKNHTKALEMKNLGMGLDPASYRDRTINNGINHLLQKVSMTTAIHERFNSMQSELLDLKVKAGVTSATVDKITEIIPQTSLSMKEIKSITKSERNKKVISLFNDGYTMTDIARTCDCHVNTVRNQLKKAGLKS
ncbi:TPA: hypothetical protein NJ328_002614 [Vibrio parahaemolyticus]|uniref:Uncharacterized protein n=1 Tax=Vibrio parahaemolyticus TaxID=670 RepID=A0AA47L7D0_VIBPH|nr:hypothetical protein [Vibrio parahaemolyticus]MCX8776618.1 hypothetical protein [Vibrio parahaemolyticus]MEA5350307.1 hypothetical protein [Vibrio parahaemolyticus]WAT91046.1 hypothetical protein O1Q84_04295 [Vibrio parahaemolyticus]HCE2184091.1 hypothetical protein [Vibrio parahaemolyticus]HCG7113752.1 hypothetical protein [Vibrio parahaemolyticus]